MKKIELLAPAGDLEKLKIAIRYGADAVYLGGKRFSLRSRASNFDLEDIAEAVKFANEYGAKIHVTVNIIPHDEDFQGIEEYLQSLEAIGVSAVIVASITFIDLVKKVAPGLEVHVSTQQSITNSKAVEYYQSMHANRVVLARECTMDQIREICENASLPIEAFIHGGMCVNYSGRCTLSNAMTLRDANRGGCAQSCRWQYTLRHGDDILTDEHHFFSMSSKDLMASAYVGKMIQAGVSSLKIEGRMKSAYYIATVVKTYRKMIDEIYEKGELSEIASEAYQREFAKAENRPTSLGFLPGRVSVKDHLYSKNGAGVTHDFIGYVLGYDEMNKHAIIQVRNYFKVGDIMEVFGPHIDNQCFKIESMLNEEGQLEAIANKPMQVLRIPCPFIVEEHDMIRKGETNGNNDI